MSRADLPGHLEGMLRSEAWHELERELLIEMAVVTDELVAMGTDAKRRDELAGRRDGILTALRRPQEIIDTIRSERGSDDL